MRNPAYIGDMRVFFNDIGQKIHDAIVANMSALTLDTPRH